MKKTILSSILLLSSTTIFADTTMCFKEGHSSMTTIENIALEGGACAGKYSIKDMKAKGWSVDDIKISQTATGMSFIYILKNGVVPATTTNFTGNQAQMEANIIAKLEKKKEEEIKAKEIQEVQEAAIDGEKIYTNKCQTCHGANGEKSAYNSARPLKSISVEDMEESIKNYKNGKVDSSNATIMTPYANYLDSKTVKGIHAYLNKINNK